jgi:glycosyltransferase involved in cell wall biosynthesis
MPDHAALTLSVIVPAFNEAKQLPRMLTNIRRCLDVLDVPSELIVVDNNSTDATPDIARAHGARVVFEPVNQISRARNAGAAAARGRYLLFVDADTWPHPDTIRQAVAAMQTGRVCGGGAHVRFDAPLHWSVAPLPRLYNALASRLGWAAGCFVFATAQAFRAVGGFSERVYASEEIWFSKALGDYGARRGLRFVVLTKPQVLSSSRKLSNVGQMWRHLLMLLATPWAVQRREACPWWYQRPED